MFSDNFRRGEGKTKGMAGSKAVSKIADLGWKEAMKRDAYLLDGLNVWNGMVTCSPVARQHGYEVVPTDIALG